MEQLFRAGLFDGEVAIVTGGGTGIGRVVARELGQLGAKIAIAGRRPEPLEDTRAALSAEGIEVLAKTCDIRKPEEVQAFVAAVLERFGKVTILVNNAGGQFPSPAEHIAPKGFEAVVRNNLLGTWTMTHAVATAAMIPAKRGRIVTITAQVERGFPGMVHTGAARAGVQNMTKTLAVEWALPRHPRELRGAGRDQDVGHGAVPRGVPRGGAQVDPAQAPRRRRRGQSPHRLSLLARRRLRHRSDLPHRRRPEPLVEPVGDPERRPTEPALPHRLSPLTERGDRR
jgi:NADP-dependent 3-hydroxy acid dehydrogenase YdfG